MSSGLPVKSEGRYCSGAGRHSVLLAECLAKRYREAREDPKLLSMSR